MLLMAGIEVIILYSSVYIAGLLTFETLEACENRLGPLAPRAASIAMVILVCLVAMGLYQFHQRMKFPQVALRVIAGVAAGTVVIGGFFYILPASLITKDMAAVSFAYSLPLLLLTRFWYLRTIDRNYFRRRILVYGEGDRAAAISELRRKADRRGFKIVGRIAPPPGNSRDVTADVGDEHRVYSLARRTDADEIVIAIDERRGKLPIRDLLDIRLTGVDVIDVIEFLERETGKIRVDLVNPGWLIFSPGFRASRFRRFNKRFVDILGSGALLLALWPIMLLVAIAIKLEDGLRAPVFYRQQRVGRNDVPFTVLKFRSMIQNAEAQGGAMYATKDDFRITRVGKWLRISRVDELPQVLNVFRGQMSLVGPRPERPEFVEGLKKRITYFSERHSVPPGITGWAQVRYGYGDSEEDAIQKLQYDLYYVKNHSLALDLAIILQTVEVVLWGKGAR